MVRSNLAAVLGSTAAALLVAVALVASSSSRTELEFANANDYLDGYVWEAPYPGAGPETPVWDRTPTSVGQGGETVNNPEHQEHNVLAHVDFPDYAHGQRFQGLAQTPQRGYRAALRRRAVPAGKTFARTPLRVAAGNKLWVGQPPKYLPPDGDYPGGATGIPLDGYLAYETGWGNDGPFHGDLAPLQEAGVAKSPVAQTLRQQFPARMQQKWVGQPPKYLPPDGDYPGGATGIPLDGYLAYETGWGNDGPFHGELAPLQEAGVAKSPSVQTLASIMDPGYKPHPFNDWALGNQRAGLDTTYDPRMWEQADPPIDNANLGKITCIMGMDCMDDTYQGGVHDNGNQLYDNYPMGSLDRNSDRSVGAY